MNCAATKVNVVQSVIFSCYITTVTVSHLIITMCTKYDAYDEFICNEKELHPISNNPLIKANTWN